MNEDVITDERGGPESGPPVLLGSAGACSSLRQSKLASTMLILITRGGKQPREKAVASHTHSEGVTTTSP